MRIIIVGCGKVGRTIAEQLNEEGHEITVIDLRADVVHDVVEDLDIMGIVGNGSTYSVLMEARVEEADLLIAVAASDELNLLCCLIARKAGGCHTIARVRNPEYNQEVGFIKEELGLSMSVNPDRAAALEIARVLRFPFATKIDTFAKGKVDMVQLPIAKDSVLNGVKLADLSTKIKCKVLVCAIERGKEILIPSGNVVLHDGDKILVVAAEKQADLFFKQAGIKGNRVKNIMIVGGSRIAFYLAKELVRSGIKVKIIEKDKNRCQQLSELIPQALIICGDGSDQNVLLEEGLAHAEAFASLTNLDEENILLSLYAGQKSNAKLITKINRVTFEEVVNTMPIGSIIYPKYITAYNILRYVRAMQNSFGSNVETLYKIIHNKVEALEFRVRENSPLVGIPLKELKLKNNLLVGYINRNGTVFIPNGQDTIQVGDTVIIVTTNTGLNDLSDILKTER